MFITRIEINISYKIDTVENMSMQMIFLPLSVITANRLNHSNIKKPIIQNYFFKIRHVVSTFVRRA